MSEVNPIAETPAPTQMEVENATTAPAVAIPGTPAPQSMAIETPKPVETPSIQAPIPVVSAPASVVTEQTTTAPAPAVSKPEEKKRDRRKDLPIRQYLDTTVVPVLLAGMSQLTKERPETDEVEWLANWMLKNNPNKKTTGV